MATAISPNTLTPKRSELAAKAPTLIFKAREKRTPLRIVVYGRNGAGKTYFAGSSDRRTLIVDCEEEGYDAVEDRDNVDVFPLKKWSDLPIIYWHLKSGEHPYEVVVLDTISGLSTLCMKWVLGDEAARDSDMDPLMPDKRHYGKLGQAMSNTIIDWRNIGVNIVILAQERNFRIQDELGNITGQETGPALTPYPLQTLLGAVGTVGRLYKREVTKTVKGKQETIEQRRMLVAGTEKFIAKTRIRGLKRVVINPTLGEILRIREQRGEVPQGQVVEGTGVDI